MSIETLRLIGGAYWQGQEGPFCTFCFNERGELVKLRFKGYGDEKRPAAMGHESWTYRCDVHGLDVYLYSGVRGVSETP